jgi:glycosyltransferase involved in cell wall biosynthesis
MYIYREQNPYSKFKKFYWGLQHTKRVVYYYEHITKEMTWLIDEIQKEDIDNEVCVYTKQCDFDQEDLKRLKRYCRIRLPQSDFAHIVRGEPCDFIKKMKQPLKCQVCIFSDHVNMVGGITTFIYNFCKALRSHYDIVFLYKNINEEKLARIRTVARCVKFDPELIVGCDVLLVQRLDDIVPENVVAKHKVQMIHCLRLPNYRIRSNVTDKVVVSQAAKDSWGEAAADAIVINNIADLEIKKSLMLVSATRINDGDKGGIKAKMFKLANKLNAAGIPFIWLVFSDRPIDKLPANMFYMKPVSNVGDFIEHADYLVQLSPESFSYTVLEALTRGTAVLVNQFGALKELGYKDGKMGYILPEDMEFDVKQLFKVPRFEFKYDNDKIISQWREFIGDLKPTEGFYDSQVKVRATIKEYYDLKLDKVVRKGEEFRVSRSRADELVYSLRFCEEVF